MTDNKKARREMFQALEAVIDGYIDSGDGQGCPCSYPRFIQLVSLDCMDMNLQFVCRETEGLLRICRERDLYLTETLEADFQADSEYWTCGSCGSRFLWGRADSKHRFDRQYLKPVILNARQLGADAASPLPLFGGFYGEKMPPARFWFQVSAAEMQQYLSQKKE